MKKEITEKEMFRMLSNREHFGDKEADIMFELLNKLDKGKTFMEILPSDFKQIKRSPIKRQILHYLDKVLELLNTSGLYDKVFTKEELVRYMMIKTEYSNFLVAYKYIPRTDSSDIIYDYMTESDWKLQGEIRKNRITELREIHKDKIDTVNNLNYYIGLLRQSWQNYEDRQKVKQGKIIDSWDIEKDGYPRTGRGNLCHLFIPIKGYFPNNKTDNFNLYNPRTKKKIQYKIESYKKEDNVYKCINEKGKTVFLIPYEEVKEAYSCLFTNNKEIYAGWWNKTLISK